MSTCIQSFHALLVACQELLPRLQSRFASYQQENFPERVPEFFCLELCGEAGELANLEKKRWKGIEVPHDKLADEAADVLIAIINYANASRIDLGIAVQRKLGIIEKSREERDAYLK
jgi:NTP pyrophosphatase (non-canonical NTP hydrolase)